MIFGSSRGIAIAHRLAYVSFLKAKMSELITCDWVGSRSIIEHEDDKCF